MNNPIRPAGLARPAAETAPSATPHESVPSPAKVPELQPYQPSRKERWEEMRPYLGPAFAALLLLGVGGWAAWRLSHAEVAPVRKSGATGRVDVVAPASSGVKGPSWRRFYAKGLADESELPAVEAHLALWVKAERERVSLAQPGAAVDIGPLNEATAALGHVRARLITMRSGAAEQAAVRAQSKGDVDAAGREWQQALRLQIEANASAINPEHKDLQRETRLARLVEASVASPLRRQADDLRAEGLRALDAQEWTKAGEALERAGQKLLDIVEAVPALRDAYAASLQQIETDRETAASGPLCDRIRAREQQAERDAAAGDPNAAAAAYEQSAALLQGLIEKYPRSRYANAARVEEFERLRQTVLSAPATQRAAALAQQVERHLRRHACDDAVRTAGEALALLEQVAVSFPRSRGWDPALWRRLEFVRLRQQDLPWIHAQVGAALAPLGGVHVSSIEVPQALYRRVMNANPSRTASPALPVESVSWLEARMFCERLSWLLGVTVRLPNETEFGSLLTAEAGPLSADGGAGEQTRAADHRLIAERRVQNAVGNVAEWLDASDASPAAVVAGGNFRDGSGPAARARVLQEKNKRSPFVGFRFVVEGSHS